MLFASSPTRMVSTRSTSSSTGATWLEVPSKCASGSLDKRGTPPWCRPMAQGSRGAPQVTRCLYLSSAKSRPQGRADGALQALESQLPAFPRETAVSCLPLPGPFRIRTLIGNSTQHLSFRGCAEFVMHVTGLRGAPLPASSLSGPWAPRNISDLQ